MGEPNGLSPRIPITKLACPAGSLSIIGLPPVGGAWGKWCLSPGTPLAGQLMLLMERTISTLLRIAFLLAVPVRAFFSPASKHTAMRVKDAPPHGLVAIAVVGPGFMALSIYQEPLCRRVTMIGKG